MYPYHYHYSYYSFRRSLKHTLAVVLTLAIVLLVYYRDEWYLSSGDREIARMRLCKYFFFYAARFFLSACDHITDTTHIYDSSHVRALHPPLETRGCSAQWRGAPLQRHHHRAGPQRGAGRDDRLDAPARAVLERQVQLPVDLLQRRAVYGGIQATDAGGDAG